MTGETSRESSWPYASLLLTGYFGADAPAGKRLRRRVLPVLVAVPVLNGLAAVPALRGVPPMVWLLSLPVGVALIVWAYLLYLGELDELSRLIQLESFAFSYGAAMTLAALGAALDLGTLPSGRPFRGFYLWLLVLVAELLRGVVLVLRARRRQ